MICEFCGHDYIWHYRRPQDRGSKDPNDIFPCGFDTCRCITWLTSKQDGNFVSPFGVPFVRLVAKKLTLSAESVYRMFNVTYGNGYIVQIVYDPTETILEGFPKGEHND